MEIMPQQPLQLVKRYGMGRVRTHDAASWVAAIGGDAELSRSACEI